MNANDVLGGLVERIRRDNWFPKVVVHCPHCDAIVGGEMRDDKLVAAVNALPLLLEVVAKVRDLIDGAGDDLRHTNASVRTDDLKGLDEALARLDEGVKP